nr:MAG TPA: hypothetical protein [Caudoviricetes sp.]
MRYALYEVIIMPIIEQSNRNLPSVLRQDRTVVKCEICFIRGDNNAYHRAKQ